MTRKHWGTFESNQRIGSERTSINTVEEVYVQILAIWMKPRKHEKLPREKYRKDYRTSLLMVQLLKPEFTCMEDWKMRLFTPKVIDD
ncbi:MAG: hypothetical protein ACLU4N_17180 [Butyricimonas faecihominis]